ncbi:saccharopine dehydrogenase family protein [Amycolatopsis circi]|uniref:saccharopine dehydrogenase family protein n=1 Tax=Amycolatopsis circi TaxID=871959 RepID=UPI000E2548D1|nr:saccharopine dehydrogenase NADP-binding domain-containing protein [Amycolatopsis circi]
MTNNPGLGAGKRILVTGGAGEMAKYACRALADSDEVGLVLVSDRDFDRAKAVAAELGPKAEALALDISDSEALGKALADVDVVLNCAGPFYRFGREVLSAAIAAQTHYLDICDDWEPTIDMLELDDAARAAGITAIIGMGSSPGTSNLLAMLCMTELDQVDKVYTAWSIGGIKPDPPERKGKPNAARDHWIHNCTEPIKVRRGGALADTYALDEIKLAYPGVGEHSVWVCGHPEPMTLPKVRPEIQESYNVMVARRGLMEALKAIQGRVKAGELDVPAAGVALTETPGINGPAAGERPPFAGLFAVAEGVKNGVATRVGATPVVLPNANMGEFTGYPLAVATVMLCRGQVSELGVHGPEGAVDPHIYFDVLADFAEDRPAGVEPVEVVTETI